MRVIAISRLLTSNLAMIMRMKKIFSIIMSLTSIAILIIIVWSMRVRQAATSIVTAPTCKWKKRVR